MSSARSKKSEISPAYIFLKGNPTPIPLFQKFQFGRTENFDNAAISRSHFTIAANDHGVYFILDHSTKTGTRVDNVPITPNAWSELKEGSCITVGPYVFSFTLQPPQGLKIKPELKLASPNVIPNQERRQNSRTSDRPVVTPQRPSTPISLVKAPFPSPQKPAYVAQPRVPTNNITDPQAGSSGDDHKNNKTFLAAMASINIVVFGIQLMMGGGIDKNPQSLLIKMGANVPYLTTGGQWWRLFSSAFLHWDLWHLLGNVAALYFATAYIVRYLTPNKIMAVYLGSAFVASVVSTLMHPVMTIAAGASGAVFGLYGAILVSVIMYHNRGIKMNPGLIVTMLHFSVMNLGIGQAGVDYWAHLGGLFAGAVIAYMCLELLPEEDSSSTGKLVATCAVIAMCAIVVLPHRKLNSQQQMKVYFADVVKVGEFYYNSHFAYDRERNKVVFERQIKSVATTLAEIDEDLQKEIPVDQKADYYKKHLRFLISKMKNHGQLITQYLHTGRRNFLSYAKQEDAVIGQEMDILGKEFLPGIEKKIDQPPTEQQKTKLKQRPRRPATSPRSQKTRAPGSRSL